MHALRNFVLGALQGASARQLAELCATLRLPSSGVKDDVVAAVMHLVELDRDSALGVFVTWHQTVTTGSEDHLLVPNAFATAFVPIPDVSTPPRPSMLDFVLDEELATVARDLAALEAAYKDAERGLHAGAVNYDKIKRFLQTLTQLRAKDNECRLLLLQKNEHLHKDNARLSRAETHTRTQLQFFLDGCSRLRARHDSLLEEVAQMAATDDMARHIVLELHAGQVAFEEVLARTLHAKCAQLDAALADLAKARATVAALQVTVATKDSAMAGVRAKWDAAAKDATCAKFQLRKCRKRLRADEAPFLRARCLELQRLAADLLGLPQVQALALFDAKANFVKSADKTSIAWRVLSYLRYLSELRLNPAVLVAPPAFPSVAPPSARRDVRDNCPVVVVLGMAAPVNGAVLRLSLHFGFAHVDVGEWHEARQAAAPETPELLTADATALDVPALARLAAAEPTLLHHYAFSVTDVRRLVQHGARVACVLDFGPAPDASMALVPMYVHLRPSAVGLADAQPWPSVDAMVAAVADLWKRRQDAEFSAWTLGWDPATSLLNERCRMQAEELDSRMAGVWGAHLKARAEKAAAAAAAAAAKRRVNNTPAKNNRAPTPSKPPAAAKKTPPTRSKTPVKTPAKSKSPTPKKPVSPPKSSPKRAR
ncbi:hypothetical protein ACHHYP_09942 [Achlya hypogyna]|uniref:Uncharacterized protein n=1 Tax=Achlya hypogyna TaxID=1202772 RepID=A0A1V9YM40_ACHHY|nr:hypothetical protein ACHHYP_09942 [Achlya hypogyna]